MAEPGPGRDGLRRVLQLHCWARPFFASRESPTQRTEAEGVSTAAVDFMAADLAVSTAVELAAMRFMAAHFTVALPDCTVASAVVAGVSGSMAGTTGAMAGG